MDKLPIFQLVHINRPTNSDALDRLETSVHKERNEAINQVFDDIKDSIEELHLDEFIEAIGDNTFEIRMFDFTVDDDEPVTHDELEALFKACDIKTKAEIADWYFELIRDECTEAGYQITQCEI
ncbi:hypothetical protein AB4254_10910 [Vibrio breoganii]